MRLRALPLVVFLAFACSEEPVHEIPPQIGVEDEDGEPLSELVFGDVPFEDEAEEGFYVASLRPTQLEVKRIEIVGEDAEHFKVEGGAFSVPKSGRAPVAVTFAPLEVGELAATLVIHSNDPRKPKVEVALEGRGIDSALRVEGCLMPTTKEPELCAETLVVAPKTLDMRGVVAGTARNARITITNLGRKPMDLHAVEFEDPDAAEELGFSLPKRTGGQVIGGLTSGGLTLGFDAPAELLGPVEIALIIKTSDRQGDVRFPVVAEILPNEPPEVCIRVAESHAWDGSIKSHPPGERVAISPGDTIFFDARVREGCTADPEDGEDLELTWSLESDIGFPVQLNVDSDPYTASFQADTIGSYKVSLVARDSAGQDASSDAEGVPAEIEFWVEPQTDIGLEIRWPGAKDVDLDVHLVRADGFEGIFGSNDFYWDVDRNSLNWGDKHPFTNPLLAVDDTGTRMVETVLLNGPEAGQTYSLLVHLWRDGRTNRGSHCTSSVTCSGGRVCAMSSDLEGQCMDPVVVSARLFLQGEEFDVALAGGLSTMALGSPCETWHIGDVIWADPPSFVAGLGSVYVEGDGVSGNTCFVNP